MARKNRWDVRSIIRNKVANVKSSGNDGAGNGQEGAVVPQSDADRDALTRDLSVGGAILVGLGAKQLLLPALALTHPLLLAVTVPATVVTGRHYLRSLWDAGTRNGPLNADALAGGVTVAAIVSGGSATALASVSVFNLGKYLTLQRASSDPAAVQESDSNQPVQPAPPPSWLNSFTHYATVASLAVGGLIFAPHFINLIPSIETSLAVTNQLVAFLQTTPYAPLLYLSAYTIAPLLLFPASLLSVASGVLFGPYWGLFYSVVGSGASAAMAYMVGRYFAERMLENKSHNQKFVQRYANWMRENPFESVLTMHILYVPYDLVNYLAGALEIEWNSFMLGTILGSLPGTSSFVLLGASLKGSAIRGIPTLNPNTLAASGVIFVGSLVLSRFFKQKTRTESAEEELESVTGELGMA